MLCHTRKDAEKFGETTYYTGKPCPMGHLSVRYTKGGGCKECNTLRQRERVQESPTPEQAARYNKKWNASTKGYEAKLRWKEKDPINAWACSAVGGAKARAEKKGLPFDLDKEYVRSICTLQCPVFGTPFVWHGKALRPDSPSLDRIEPNKGYVRGNVVVISVKANAIKSDATVEEIQTVADWLRNRAYY